MKSKPHAVSSELEDGHRQALALEPELAAVYASQFRKVAKHAASRFEALAPIRPIVAAVDPTDEPPDWSPPDPDELVNAAEDDADAETSARKIHLEAISAATPAAIQATTDITDGSPFAAPLLEKVGTKSVNLGLAARDVITKIIGESYAQGLSVPHTAAALRSGIDHLSTTTALMQARTDLNGLANGASLQSVALLGDAAPGFKEWLATDDERTRETHADADGQVVPIDQPFAVGDDSLMYPGDPDGSDEEVINCRCTLVYTDQAGNEEEGDVDNLTAGATSFEDLPLSERDRAWDSSAAKARVAKWASSDGSGDKAKIDWTKYGRAFLYSDAGDANNFGDYHLPFADVIGGTLTAVWRGITSAAQRLSGTDIAGKSAVQSTIRSYYAKAAKQYDDKTIKAPFTSFADAAVCADCGHAFADHLGTSGPCTYEDGRGTCSCSSYEKMAIEVGVLTAAAGDPIPWRAVLIVEGEETSDGRYIDVGAIDWRPLPLTLMAMIQTEDGHDGAQVAGRIDNIYRDETMFSDARVAIVGEGVFDTGDYGTEIARLVSDETLRGVSADLGAAEVTIRERPTLEGGPDIDLDEPALPDEMLVYTKALLLGATVCPFPAIGSGAIEVLGDETLEEYGGRHVERLRIWTPGFEQMFADSGSLTASALGLAPLAPPAEWFADPELDGPTPLTVSDDGRVFGHAALWNSCHIAYPQGASICTTPPRSSDGYPYFHLGEIVLDDGEPLAVGTVTMDTGHAALSDTPKAATRHYDDTGTVAAHVRAGNDRHGIWLAGALEPTLNPTDVRRFQGAKVSGDWRKIGGHAEMVAALAVNVPGFPIPRPAIRASAAGEHELLALTAAGIVGETPPTEAETRARIAALAARALGREALIALAIGDTGELWDPERGVCDIMDDLSVILNPDGTWRWWVVDLAIGGGSAILCDSDSNDYWLAGISYDVNEEPVLAPTQTWIELEETWIASSSLAGRVEAMRELGPKSALVAAGMRISIEVDGETLAVAPASVAETVATPAPTVDLTNENGLDQEIGLQSDYVRDHGYYSQDRLSGADLTRAQLGVAQRAASGLVADPTSPANVALKARLISKGYLIGA